MFIFEGREKSFNKENLWRVCNTFTVAIDKRRGISSIKTVLRDEAPFGNEQLNRKR